MDYRLLDVMYFLFKQGYCVKTYCAVFNNGIMWTTSMYIYSFLIFQVVELRNIIDVLNIVHQVLIGIFFN